MPVYVYKAKRADAQTVTGEIAARDMDDAFDLISRQGLLPVAVDEKGGVSPFVPGCPVSPAAVHAITHRKTPIGSWYFDMTLLRKYWGSERVYHHTPPVNLYFALHEALSMALEEGLPSRWARHQAAHAALKTGLARLGIGYLTDPGCIAPTLNCVAAPAGIDEAAGRKQLLNEFGIEVGAGLGDFKGKAWRIGLMGEGADQRHVDALLSALTVIAPKG